MYQTRIQSSYGNGVTSQESIARVQIERDKVLAAAGLQVGHQAGNLFGRRDRYSYDAMRANLACRLDVLNSNYEAAYANLAKRVSLRFPIKDDDTLSDRLRRNRWRRGHRGTAEEYSLLAIAALKTGRPDVALRAAEEAEERGSDISMLQAVLADL